MENKFKKGLILGGLLAVGTAIGFAMTKGGQELAEDLQNDFKFLTRNLKKSLRNAEDVTKESFDAMVNTVVEEYTKKKELATDAKKALVNALEEKWQEMEAEYLAEQEEEKTKK